MEASPSAPAAVTSQFAKAAYQFAGYFGLMAVFGSLIFGFRHDPSAPLANLWFNLGIYALFAIFHLFMTRPAWKRRLTGNPAGTPRERRVYITTSVVMWLAILWLHRPLPGPELALSPAVRFAGTVFFLLAFFLFFQGITMAMIDGLLGVPGAVQGYSHGSETPLFTEGPYAEVRHPMYRGAAIACLASLIVHPNAGQLLWAVLIAGTFVAYIPVEEAQMIAARGDDYRRYREKTPWRLFRGIW